MPFAVLKPHQTMTNKFDAMHFVDSINTKHSARVSSVFFCFILSQAFSFRARCWNCSALCVYFDTPETPERNQLKTKPKKQFVFPTDRPTRRTKLNANNTYLLCLYESIKFVFRFHLVCCCFFSLDENKKQKTKQQHRTANAKGKYPNEAHTFTHTVRPLSFLVIFVCSWTF